MTALARATIEQLMSPEEKTAAEKYALEDDDEKVYFLTCMMRQLRWHRGVTNRELAILWGMSVDRVAGLSQRARASIVMEQREAFESPDALRFELKDKVESLIEKAMSATKFVVVGKGDDQTVEEVPAPDLKAAIAGIRQISELFGLGTKRLIKQGNELDKMSDSELAGQLAAALEEKRIREEKRKDGEALAADEGVPSERPSGDGAGRSAPKLSPGARGRDEDRAQRTRSTDRAHPRPGDHENPSVAKRQRRGARGEQP